MAHNRDATLYNSLYLFRHGYAALKLDCLSTSFLDKAGSIFKGT